MIASFSSRATVLTVSNDPLGGAQYSDLQSAYSAASNGDTLILEGTNLVYRLSYTYWDKSLIVIGEGFNTNKDNFKRTIIYWTDGYGNLRMGSSGSGSSFYGIVFTDQIAITGSMSNVTFEDCEFQLYINTENNTVTNFTFRNCIFGRDNTDDFLLASSASTTISFLNCVFDGKIEGYSNSLNTLLVDHCLFLSTSTGHFSGIVNASITNCVFMNYFPSGTSGCNYLNNICAVAGTFPPVGNTGSGNIDDTDPLLVSYTSGSLYDPSQDYHLQGGSPCISAGSDGTDIGIHGGTAKFSETGEALVAPVVRSFYINNVTVAPNGTLNVDVSASKPTDE